MCSVTPSTSAFSATQCLQNLFPWVEFPPVPRLRPERFFSESVLPWSQRSPSPGKRRERLDFLTICFAKQNKPPPGLAVPILVWGIPKNLCHCSCSPGLAAALSRLLCLPRLLGLFPMEPGGHRGGDG